jgi:hypothetical protein
LTSILIGTTADPTAVAAAPVPVTFSLTGTFVVGGFPLTLPPGSTFAATFDTSTGAMTAGSISVPKFNAAAAPGFTG